MNNHIQIIKENQLHNSATVWPVALIGAGAAAISAATWLHQRNIHFIWLSDSDRIGGTLNSVHNTFKNFPPNHYPNGAALVADFKNHLLHCNISPPLNQRVESITVDTDTQINTPHFQHHEHAPVQAQIVILATGTHYRRLNIPGEDVCDAPYISQSSMADAGKFSGQIVAVVGGGDAAFENALHLAAHNCKVHLLARNHNFRARNSFVEAALSHPYITIFPTPVTVQEIAPINPELPRAGCVLTLQTPDGPQSLSISCLFVRIGVEPVVPPTTPPLHTQQDGYVITDLHQRTNHPNILAAGDLTDCTLRSIATAVGSGATAARTAADALENPHQP